MFPKLTFRAGPPRVRTPFVLLAVVSALWAGCGEDGAEPTAPEAPRATTVEVSPATAELAALGATVQLSAAVRDQNGQAMAGASVSWSSGDTLAATVDASGLVTAVGNGTATITATSGSASGSGAVMVDQATSAVVVSPAEDTVVLGDTLRLTAEAFDANGHRIGGAVLSWSSSDAGVAQVDESGLVRGVAEGTVRVTAAAGDASGVAGITVENPDRAALVALYEATDGPNWVDNTNWLSDAPLGDWYGVDTDASGRVVELRMAQWDSETRAWKDNNLNGRIPPEIKGLSKLRSLLSISNIRLTGAIPPELGELASLESLILAANRLTGAIPPELGRLSALRTLNLNYNGLTGPIPPELGNLSELTTIRIYGNRLTGPIPPELGDLAKLESLGMQSNELTGPIPDALGRLLRLQSLRVRNNRLTGPIPLGFVALRAIRELRFSGNAGLCTPSTSGFLTWLRQVEEKDRAPYCSAPDEAALRSLHESAQGSSWARSDGWLGGPSLDDWFGVSTDSIGRVATLELSANGLSGQLPGSLGGMEAMTRLRIGGNEALTGRLPLSLAVLALREFDWSGTNLCAPSTPRFREWLNGIPTQNGTGEECEPLPDRDVLEAFYNATGGENWINSENWLTDASLGEWHGVSVNAEGRVTRLALSGNNLSGRLPEEVAYLSALEALSLWANPQLTVPLSPLGDVTSLSSLAIGGGTIVAEGIVPPELGRLRNLRYLALGNAGLSGSIPPELGDLLSLRNLRLEWNELTGPIPPELHNLSEIESMGLYNNRLTGPIPPELGNLTSLRSLDLRLNRLTGPIPPEFGDLTALERLQLGDNQLTGPIPPELGGLGRLKSMELYRNRLAGGVPRELGNLASLSKLVLNGNANLVGPVPTSLATLPRLDTLSAGGTGLCAEMTPEFKRWLDGLGHVQLPFCGGDEGTFAYITQPIQSQGSPVPLVAGKPALLRVFVSAPGATTEPLPLVRATLFLNGAEVHRADIASGAHSIPSAVDEGDLSKSANVMLPARVVQPGLEMVVEIDPDDTLDLGSLGVPRRIPATGRTAVGVARAPVLDLTLVPLLWTEAPDSAAVTAARGMTADPKGHKLLRETRALLPIGGLEVEAHDPVLTSSNWGEDMISLLQVLRTVEGGTGHYHGVYAGDRPDGIGGQGVIPGRVGWSEVRDINSAHPGSIFAHELGHNMSLWHAPAANRANNTLDDPLFPRTDGSIGAWGYDFESDRLVPPSAGDVMGGSGNPPWISGYHFTKALRFQVADEEARRAAAPARSLLLWGGADAEGEPFLEPAFVVEAPPSISWNDPAGAYTLVGRDNAGTELFSLRFDMAEISHADGASSFAFALPVNPGWEALVSVALLGPGGQAVLDGSIDRPVAILRNPRNGQVRGILRDPPPPTQVAADAVGAAAGPGLEVLFSRGIPDAAAWRRR